MNDIFTSENLISLVSLAAMEIVLGIDNIVFIAILSERVAPDKRARARQLGLIMALATRLGLLFTLSFIMRLTQPLFTIMDKGFSGRDLVLLGGGLFLLAKSTHEIYDKLEGDHSDETKAGKGSASFASVLVQIMLLDVVFSLDSVITAVGMAQQIWVMVVAMVIAVAVMLIFAGSVSEFINRHPSMKILALSFLLLIGSLLVAESLGQHVGKGYIYFSMAFALVIELLNMRFRKKQKVVPLHHRFEGDSGPGQSLPTPPKG